MKNNLFKGDIIKLLFSIIFIFIILLGSYWIIKPFILSFSWASIVVIVTWPLIKKLQYLCYGVRSLAIIIMIIILILLFIIPIIFLINTVITNSTSFIQWIIFNRTKILELSWLNDIPIIGKKIYINYHCIIKNEYFALISKLRPYIGKTTGFVFSQASYFGKFMIHIILMLLFSILLYSNGKKIGKGIRNFAYKVDGNRGDSIVLFIVQSIRSIALGIVISTFIQSILAIIGILISQIPYIHFISILIIFFCLIQIGPLPILIPLIIWLYLFNHPGYGTLLLIWSGIISMLDNILKPFLIRINFNVPQFITLIGIIGGIFSFGLIGIFLGPIFLGVSYRLLYLWIYDVTIQY